jgi:O-antigen/teichoic acid export membrane protein
MQIDYLVMSQKVNALEIIQYFTIGKIFSFVSFFNSALLYAAWPTLTALYANGDFPPIRLQIKRLIIISGSVTFAATIFVLLTQDYLGSFLAPGKEIEIRSSVIIGFGAVALIRCFIDPFAIFLQSIGKLNLLIVFAAIQAVLCASMQWILAESFGIEGILLALLLSFLLTSAWALPQASLKLLTNGFSSRI